MTTSTDDCRCGAEECLNCADKTDDEELRQAFLQMAKLWMQIALHSNEAQALAIPAAEADDGSHSSQQAT
jgi:hypothetical protein